MKIAKNFKIKTAQENGEIELQENLTRDINRELNLQNQNMESKEALIAYAEDQDLANEYVNILKIENIPSAIKAMNNQIGLFVPEIYIDEALEIIDSHSPGYEDMYQGNL